MGMNTDYLSTQYDLNDPVLLSVVDDIPLWSAPFGMKLLEVVREQKKYSCTGYRHGTWIPISGTCDAAWFNVSCSWT